VDAIEWSTSIHALAVSLSKSLSQEDYARAALLFTQLGTTMSVIVALQDLDQGASAAQEAADLSGVV